MDDDDDNDNNNDIASDDGASVGFSTPGTSNSEGGHGRSEVDV
jgi:hypothetical protein